MASLFTRIMGSAATTESPAEPTDPAKVFKAQLDLLARQFQIKEKIIVDAMVDFAVAYVHLQCRTVAGRRPGVTITLPEIFEFVSGVASKDLLTTAPLPMLIPPEYCSPVHGKDATSSSAGGALARDPLKPYAPATPEKLLRAWWREALTEVGRNAVIDGIKEKLAPLKLRDLEVRDAYVVNLKHAIETFEPVPADADNLKHAIETFEPVPADADQKYRYFKFERTNYVLRYPDLVQGNVLSFARVYPTNSINPHVVVQFLLPVDEPTTSSGGV
jgi:hypothetical protein